MNKEKLRFNTNHYDDSPEGLGFAHFEAEQTYEIVPAELARELGGVAVSLAMSKESNSEVVKGYEIGETAGQASLEALAMDNLKESGSDIFSLEDQEGMLEFLGRDDEQSIEARQLVGSVLGDDLIVEYLTNRTGTKKYEQSQSQQLYDQDLIEDVRSQVLQIANNSHEASYAHRIDDVNRFLEGTEAQYIQARDSGYPEVLLVRDRLTVFSRYAGNNIPFGENLIDHSIDKSRQSFEVASELGEGAAEVFSEDEAIAIKVLDSEAYRRKSIHNYDPITKDGCEVIAEGVRSIKSHGDSKSQEGLAVVESYLGNGLKSDVHMIEFTSEVLGSDTISSLRADHDDMMYGLIGREVDRFSQGGESIESVVAGVESFIEWFDDAGYDRSSQFGGDFRLAVKAALDISGSNSPESLVDTFKSLEFADRLTASSANESEYREQIIRDLFMHPGELVSNPGLANESYSMYDSQLGKGERDFGELYRVKAGLDRDFLHLGEDYKGQINEHFSDLYLRYINRTDKDGNRFDSARSIYSAIHDSYLNRGGWDDLTPEALEWFESSNRLPMFAYSSVAKMRQESLGRGVEDNPDSVYDFIYSDPEMVQELSSVNREGYIRRLAARDYEPMTFPGAPVGRRPTDEALYSELGERVERDAERRSGDFRTFINLSEETLKSVAASDMQLRSMLDASVELDRGSHYDSDRSGVEIALGIRSLDSDDPHPIYGSAGFVDQGYPAGAWGYGEVMLVFNDEDMNSRSTYTAEDSFHGANRLTREDAMRVRAAKDICGLGHTATFDYVEAQVRGSVDITKVEMICVEDSSKAHSLRQFLPSELHGKITVRPVDRSNP